MHYFDSTTIDGPIYLHQVGNKLNNDKLVLSERPLEISNDLLKDLETYFLSHFKQMEYYCFSHDISLSSNEVYNYVTAIFEDSSLMAENSKYLAITLYSSSDHPNIKGGDFYVVKFKNCLVDGQMVDAVGLFKSENKDMFFKVLANEDHFELINDRGVNVNKLDKGCIIFNICKESGYMVSIVDNTNRGEAKYWIQDFLQLKRINDSYTQTQNLVQLCKEYISKLPCDIDKVDKAAMMNRVIDGLHDEVVDVKEFAIAAFGQELAETSFDSFMNQYLENHDISFSESFQGCTNSIKSSAFRKITSIRLDGNFVINIHGGEEMIVKEFDAERGMMYYKLYYKEER